MMTNDANMKTIRDNFTPAELAADDDPKALAKACGCSINEATLAIAQAKALITAQERAALSGTEFDPPKAGEMEGVSTDTAGQTTGSIPPIDGELTNPDDIAERVESGLKIIMSAYEDVPHLAFQKRRKLQSYLWGVNRSGQSTREMIKTQAAKANKLRERWIGSEMDFTDMERIHKYTAELQAQLEALRDDMKGAQRVHVAEMGCSWRADPVKMPRGASPDFDAIMAIAENAGVSGGKDSEDSRAA